MKVIFSDRARTALFEIGDYIAKDNPSRARSFVAGLRSKALELGEMPLAFPLIPRYSHLGIRRRPVGSYLIFYRVETDFVAIIHILHGAMDYENLFRADVD